MGGGLLQLAARGTHDSYLTGNPQITLFKVVYRRHTNFAMESIPQMFDGTVAFDKKVKCTIPKNGDLVHKLFVRVKFSVAGNADCDLRRFVKNVKIDINGQVIDKLSYRWQAAWQHLTYSESKKACLYNMVTSTGNATDYYYIPIDFWFCRHVGGSLPLVALPRQDVNITVEFDSAANIKKNSATGTNLGGSAVIDTCELMVDYIFLEDAERRRFAQNSHQYLIEQVQDNNGTVSLGTSGSNRVELKYNHPVKELVWWIDGSSDTYVKTAKLQLNGQDRFREMDGDYFCLLNPMEHHTGCGASVLAGQRMARARNVDNDTWNDSTYYCYSFALKPEEHQPTGTCNFSSLDSAIFYLTTNNASGTLYIYAHNYNVLGISGGNAGLIHSN